MACLFLRHGIWQIKYKRNGQWVYRSCATKVKAEALRIKDQITAKEAAQPPVRKEHRDITLADLLRNYNAWADGRRSANTLTGYYGAVQAAGEAIAAKPVHTLTRKHIDAWRTSYGSTRTASTVNEQIRRLGSLVRRGIKEGWYAGTNPFQNLEPLPTTKRAPRWLNRSQLDGLLACAQEMGNAHHSIVVLGAYAGLRRGEMVAARWDWFDTSNRLLHVRPTDDWSPKNKKERTLPLHRRVADLIPPDPIGHVIYQQDRTVYDTVKALAKAINIPWLTPHVLRHTFASQAVMAGVPLYTVSSWLGHASITTTQIYAHLAPQHDLMDRLG